MSAAEQGVTIGFREIYDLAKESAEGVRAINARLDKMEDATELSSDAHTMAKNALERIEAMEKHLTWIWRTIVGALVVSAAGILFTHLHFS